MIMQLNPATRAALDAAIQEDHPCDDRGCDIAVARAHGFIEAAAHLLTGATETPAVDAVIARYSLVIPGVHSPAFDRWVAFHRQNGRQCPGCEGFMYANPDTGSEPSSCTNCGGMMLATPRGYVGVEHGDEIVHAINLDDLHDDGPLWREPVVCGAASGVSSDEGGHDALHRRIITCWECVSILA